MMIASIVVHILTTFAMNAFQRPREITWVTGVLLFSITFGFRFTDYLLPCHRIAVNGTYIGLQTIDQLGAYLH